MKKPRMANAMGQIDEELITEAVSYRPKRSGMPTAVRWIAAAACLCLLLGTGGALMGQHVMRPEKAEKPQPSSSGTAENKHVIWGQSAATGDEGFVSTNGKQYVTSALHEALKAAGKQDVFAVSAGPMLHDGLIYHGKTLEEYRLPAEQERELPDKLALLQKEGEELKYGEALCEGGAPNGVKWSREFYEERIQFYGKDLLDRYIRDGVFLADQVRADLAACDRHAAQDAYENACRGLKKELLNGAKKQAEQLHLSFRISKNGQKITLFLTADQFTDLQFGGNAEWIYELALKDGDTPSPEDQ